MQSNEMHPKDVQNHLNPSCWTPILTTSLTTVQVSGLSHWTAWMGVRCFTDQFLWGSPTWRQLKHSWLSTDPARVSDVVNFTQKPKPVSSYFGKWMALLVLKWKKKGTNPARITPITDPPKWRIAIKITHSCCRLFHLKSTSHCCFSLMNSTEWFTKKPTTLVFFLRLSSPDWMNENTGSVHMLAAALGSLKGLGDTVQVARPPPCPPLLSRLVLGWLVG